MVSYTMQIKEAELEEGGPSQRPIAFTPSDNEQVSVIRKEFVALTGDHFSAVILNQLLYWTQRVRDFDLLLEEERCFNPDCNAPPRHGWIYKTAHDLIEETMLGISHPTMRKYLKLLIDQGWIDERAHPNDKWNKTTQYRVNIRKLQEDLIAMGRNLPTPYLKAFSSSLLVENLRGFSLSSPPESKENPNVKNLQSNVSHLQSNVRNLHSYTYTETTSEIKNKEHTHRAREDFNKNFFEEVLQIWKFHIGQDVHLTKERKHRLQSLLTQHFNKDLTQWKRFCERVKASPFLMGEGPRHWRVSLDWILNEANLLKVLEGNFDTREQASGTRSQEMSQEKREKERQIILESIQDLTWKEWCVHLTQSYPNDKDPVTLGELGLIAAASFLEVENDRLVWIGSSDKKVLDSIEKLRLKLLPIIQKTYPNARNLRTRILPSPRHVLQTRETPLNLTGERSHE